MNPIQRQSEIKSLRERILLKEFLEKHSIAQHIKYTPYNGKDKHDATWIAVEELFNGAKVGNRVIAETKIRNWSMDYEGYVIQKDKYDYILSQSEYHQPLYINFFHEQGVLLWNLKKVKEPIWKEKAERVNNHGEEEKIKIVGDLMKSEAIIIMDKDVDIWASLDKAEHIWKLRNIEY